MKLIVIVRVNTFTLQDIVNFVLALRDDLKALDNGTLGIEMREISEFPEGLDLKLVLVRRKAKRGRVAEHAAQCLVNVAGKALGTRHKHRGIQASVHLGNDLGSFERRSKKRATALEEK